MIESELRELVREILAEVVPAELAGDRPAPAATSGSAPSATPPRNDPAPPPHPEPTTAGGPAPAAESAGGEIVSLHDDAELDAFVRRLVVLFENPVYRRDVKLGRIRFRLAAGARPALRHTSGEPATTGAQVVRIERGAVTEKRIRQAAASGSRIVVGRGAVVTPLARDRARAMGVVVERER